MSDPICLYLTLAISELLQLALDMCKLRVPMMAQDCRKLFFSVLTSLIEKSSDSKLLKTITRIVDDWIRNRVSMTHTAPSITLFCTPLFSIPLLHLPILHSTQHEFSHSGPTLREKTLLLSRMMTFYDKRFPDDLELNTMFLDIVHYVYR